MYPETTSQPHFSSQRPTLSGKVGMMMLVYPTVCRLYEADFYNYILQVRQINTEQLGRKKAIRESQ